MGKIEEPGEPFGIQVIIEGNSEKLLIIPNPDEPNKYEVFDEYTSIGTVWSDQGKQGRIWCGEGFVVKELLQQIGEQINDYLQNKPL
nr:hypothetical protein [Pedobacter panaciterrae]